MWSGENPLRFHLTADRRRHHLLVLVEAMKKLLKALEAASVELGHLTEPPWCAYTECVARIRD